jgi:pteridine reductase
VNEAAPPPRRRALVTGAAKRVGRAIALALGASGMDVAIHYRASEEEADATCRELSELGARAMKLQADLTDRTAARKVVDDAASSLGGLDLLVVNAAGYERAAFDDLDDAAWDRMLELNLTSPFVLAQRATPLLRAAKGSIVFVTCASATVPFRRHLPYVVSKGGLRHLMRTLALELAPDVRVNAVAPGTVLVPDDMSEADATRIRNRIPMGRFGAPDDVAQAVLYLVNAPFVTGHEIVVDGGRTVAGT